MGDIVYTRKTAIASYRFTDSIQYSFLVVHEPLTPLIYRRDGYDAESIMIQSFDGSSVRVPHMSGERSSVSSATDFLEYFTYIEFYFNQLLKLILIESFSVEQWVKLEIVVSSESLTMRSKVKILKKIDPNLWNAIKPNLSELQELRNSISHSPVGPYRYKSKELDWKEVDKDMAALTTKLLFEYKQRQIPILDFAEEHDVNTENKEDANQ